MTNVKVALISDVHSNIVALDAVLGDIDDVAAERIVCAGDIVGYYPHPNETIERFRSRNIQSILGNHDRAVIRINPVGMNKMAADALTQEWWTYCKPCQDPLPTRAEGEWWAGMEEVFHCD